MVYDTLEPTFPVEFLVLGTPVSLQTKRSASKLAWKQAVRAASQTVLPEGHWATRGPIAATLYYFQTKSYPAISIISSNQSSMHSARNVYLDDAQVERIVVQRFDRNSVFPFGSPSRTLRDALIGKRPLLYIRLSDDPHEDLA